MRAHVLLAVLTATWSSSSAARPAYVNLVPNGAVSGCQTCHSNRGGGAPWNSFGDTLFVENGGTVGQPATIDVADADFSWWSGAICGADSDDDGQTNGQELGDPRCVWTSGPAPRRTAVSNPGNAAATSTNPDGGDVDVGEGEGEGDVIDEPAEAPVDSCGNSSVAGIAPLLLISRRWRRRRGDGASSSAARR